ncbi:MAG TPA: DUF1592 domain-containing protein [Pirellulales bacterium]|nr:DUF1592 domain-containing protein [Pirellulales bacterium]
MHRSLAVGSLVAWSVLGTFRQIEADDAVDSARLPDPFVADVQPLLTKYCFECHGEHNPKADLNLAATKDLASVTLDRKVWQAALDQLRSYGMPPEDKPQPSSLERQQMVEFLEAEFRKADRRNHGPGRVTMRRLNRVEYDNTVRDLLGFDFHASDDFPSDDVGYGFDNIGDVLSLPPILMEKYLAASEKIALTAVVAKETARPKTMRIESKSLQNTVNRVLGGELVTNGQAFTTFDCSNPGEYRVRVSAWGSLAGKDLPHMVVKIDDKPMREFDINVSKGSQQECVCTFEAEPGEHKVAAEFTNDFYERRDGQRPLDRNLTVEWIELTAPVSLQACELPESHKRIVTCRPASNAERSACAQAVIQPLALRAFRRPPTEEEVTRLVKLVELAMDQGDSFERGVQLAIEAMLVSPHFLFRVEAERTSSDDGTYDLNDYELASRLSYFLWSSMPDEQLFALARAGKLHDPETLAEQARRMIADPRSQSLVENFSSQWLQTRNLSVVTPATAVFSTYDPSLGAAMRVETEMFFAYVMREDRSLGDFLDADYTFLNDRLANHYGIEGVEGPGFRRVMLEDSRRGGVLTQASVLTVTSNSTRTSPVKRGRWVLENILGTPPPPPPPDVPELNEDKQIASAASLRERLEEHRSNAACASCHARMDPLGFGLENYDGIGAWRDKDGTFAIDATGVLPDGQKFDGPHELKSLLRSRVREFATCLTEKMLTYALGRGLESSDRYTVEKIVDSLEQQDYRFSVLVAEIVRSEPFVKRACAGDKS